MKKIMGVILSSLMLLNPAFNVTYATNTETKNVNHISKKTRNKILKYISVGAFATVGLLATGGLAYAGYNYFSDTIEYPLIFNLNSKGVDFSTRTLMVKLMISKYRKSGRGFVVITRFADFAEDEYIIQLFDREGKLFNVMEVNVSELYYILGGSHKVEQVKTGVYSGTGEIFERIFELNSKKSKLKISSKLEDLLGKAECKFTLTALFYDNDEELEKFMGQALMFQYNDNPFEKLNRIRNDFERYGINTFYDENGYKVITKFIPIDSRKLKDMSPSEREKVEKLLKNCTSGIIILDFSNSELKEIYNAVDDVFDEKSYEKILEKDITMNHVLKFICSVSWGDFLNCYIYNKPETKIGNSDKLDKLYQYVKNSKKGRWDMHFFCKSIKNTLHIITHPMYCRNGLEVIEEREDFAKKYIKSIVNQTYN